MAMKAELAELRAFKATTTPAATTGAAHTGGKRARVQQDRLPKLRASGELPAHHECCENYLHKHHACINAGIVSIKSSCTGDLHKHHECCEITNTSANRTKPEHVAEEAKRAA